MTSSIVAHDAIRAEALGVLPEGVVALLGGDTIES